MSIDPTAQQIVAYAFAAFLAAITAAVVRFLNAMAGRMEKVETKIDVAQTKLDTAQKELATNTEITAQAAVQIATVKKMVNGAQEGRDQRADAAEKRVDGLQAAMERHGIECPDPPAKKP